MFLFVLLLFHFLLHCEKLTDSFVFLLLRMSSVYKRKPGSRAYRTQYSQEMVKAALKEVRNGKSVFAASKEFKIPYGTLYNYSRENPIHEKGRPRRKSALSEEEKNTLVELISHLTSWKFPIDSFNIKQIVHSYLMKKNITVKQFKDNWPGKDWLLARHEILT